MTAPWPYPAPADDGGASPLAPGQALPDVELRSTHGGKVNIAGLVGRWVIFIYPWTGRPGLDNPPGWDDIPGAHGSTPEAEGFRDHYATMRGVGIDVLGISGQDTEHQAELARRLKLPYALLSDAEGELRHALRLPTFLAGGRVFLKRLSLVVRDGRVERTIYPVHPPHTHAGDLLASLRQRSLP